MAPTVDQALLQAVEAHHSGNLHDAERLYRAILQTQPTHPDANHNLGILVGSQGNHEAALPFFQTALESDPTQRQFWLSYITALIKAKRPDTARAILQLGQQAGLAGETVDQLAQQLAPPVPPPGQAEPLAQKKVATAPKRLKPASKKQQRKAAKPFPQHPQGPRQTAMDALIDSFHKGFYAEAERMALEMTRAYPKDAFGWKALGAAILNQPGRALDALMPMEKAAALMPNDTEAQNNLGATLQKLGRFAEAESYFRKALALNPDSAETQRNLGATLQHAGRFAEAETCFRKAIALKPDYAEAQSNLGVTLHNLGRFAEAEACLRAALALKPDYAEAQSNLGVTLYNLGRLAEAEACHRHAIALKPDLAEAHANLGNALKTMSRPEEAEQGYRRAFALKPSAPEYLFLAELMLPRITSSVASITTWRKHYQAGIDRLRSLGQTLDHPEKTISGITFDLAFHNRNDRDIMRELSALFRSKAPSLHFTSPHLSSWQPPNNRRIRIGICSQFLVNHTIGKLYQGLIRHLDRAKFEIILLHTPQAKLDNLSTMLDRLADHSMHLPLSLPSQQKAVASQQLDILFYPDIGMSSATYFLAYARLAPIQVVSWGHPDTTGIETLDYFISAETIEPEDAEEHYCERLIRMRRLPCFYDPLCAPSQIPDRVAMGLPATGTLYGCPQALFKFHPDFDEILSQIAEGDPTGHILLIEGSVPEWTELLRTRWQQNYPILTKRVTILPRQPQDRFMALMAHFDVLLDPIHFGSGNTMYEAKVYGTPTITWAGRFMRGRIVAGAYKQMGIPDPPVAKALKDYVPLALELGRNEERRRRLREEILQAGGALFSDATAIREFEEFCTAAVQAAANNEKLPPKWQPTPNKEHSL